jgi:curved DNA-binding protein
MKYKDYYAILGVARDADEAAIKKAYRKLAHKYHPDVSKDPGGEEKFKAAAEAYATLKDKDKRAAYDQLGRHQPGEEFRPPPDWGGGAQGGQGTQGFEDIDLSDLFAHFAAGGAPRGRAGPHGQMPPIPGENYEVTAHITLEDAFAGTLVDLDLSVPEYDGSGQVRRVARKFKARIPKGATDGQRLRLRGKGGKGLNGGPDGDLYLNIALHPHALFRASGHDLYVDLPLAPWEAVLGASVEVPTLGGAVQLKVPPGTQAGRKLRLGGRGLPKPPHAQGQGDGAGDLYALVQIVVPGTATDKERALYQQLADEAAFNPRGHFEQGVKHAH